MESFNFTVAELFTKWLYQFLSYRVYESSTSFPTFGIVRHFTFCLSDSKPHSKEMRCEPSLQTLCNQVF